MVSPRRGLAIAYGTCDGKLQAVASAASAAPASGWSSTPWLGPIPARGRRPLRRRPQRPGRRRSPSSRAVTGQRAACGKKRPSTSVLTPARQPGPRSRSSTRDGVVDLSLASRAARTTRIRRHMLGAGFGIFNRVPPQSRPTCRLARRSATARSSDGHLHPSTSRSSPLATSSGHQGPPARRCLAARWRLRRAGRDGHLWSDRGRRPGPIIPDLEASTDRRPDGGRRPQRAARGRRSRQLVVAHACAVPARGPSANEDDDSPVAIQLGCFDDTAGDDVVALAKLVNSNGPASGRGGGLDTRPRVSCSAAPPTATSRVATPRSPA